jgi:hypothetical protein
MCGYLQCRSDGCLAACTAAYAVDAFVLLLLLLLLLQFFTCSRHFLLFDGDRTCSSSW